MKNIIKTIEEIVLEETGFKEYDPFERCPIDIKEISQKTRIDTISWTIEDSGFLKCIIISYKKG